MVGNVHPNGRAGRVELEPRGMVLEVNVARHAAARGVDYRDSPIGVTNVDAMSCGIDPNIVRIRAQIDSADRDCVFPLIDANRTITGIRDVDAVRGWLISDALGLFEPGDRP
jgi:hypothetical protein